MEDRFAEEPMDAQVAGERPGEVHAQERQIRAPAEDRSAPAEVVFAGRMAAIRETLAAGESPHFIP